MRKLILGSVLFVALHACFTTARAEDVISLPGGNAVLNAPKSVVASVILAPGADLNEDNPSPVRESGSVSMTVLRPT